MADTISKISINNNNGMNVTQTIEKDYDIERGEGRFGVGVSPSTGHPRPASASTSAPGSAPTSTPRESSNANRCDLRVTAGVGRDVNAGTHQDDGQWTARAGVGAGPMARRSERDSGSGSRWKTVGRFLRRLTFVMFLLALTAATLALVTIYMGPIYLVQLLLVVSVAYFVAGGRLRWFYVAPRVLIVPSMSDVPPLGLVLLKMIKVIRIR